MTRARIGRIVLGGAVVAAFAILMALGTWQVQRLSWKEALIANARERPAMAPVAAPGPAAWDDFAIAAWTHRRVALTGRFGADTAYAWTVLSDTRGPLDGPGYFVIAPFETADGWQVLVNRGFVPEDRRDPSAWDAPLPDGTVTIEGIVRRDDPPNFVTPAPDRATNTVFARHIATLGDVIGIEGPLAPYTVDLAPGAVAGAVPQAGEWRVNFSNNHLQYAITWYGIGAALLGVVAAALWRRKRTANPAG